MQSVKLSLFDSLIIAFAFVMGCFFLNWERLNQSWANDGANLFSFKNIKFLHGLDKPLLPILFEAPPQKTSMQMAALPKRETIFISNDFFKLLESMQWAKSLRTIEFHSNKDTEKLSEEQFQYQSKTMSYMFQAKHQKQSRKWLSDTETLSMGKTDERPVQLEISTKTTEKPTIFSPQVFEKLKQLSTKRDPVEVVTTVADKKSAETMKKKKISHEQNLRDINALIQAGKVVFAGEQLKYYIETYPTVSAYQLLLGEMYLSLKQYDKLENLVSSKIYQPENSEAFVTLLARAYIDQNNFDAALSLLSSNNQPLKKAPNLYALIANIYQRMQLPEKALAIYEELVNYYPNQGKWWLGLALSLEGARKDEKAISAYESALQDNHLTTELHNYAKERIDYLRNKAKQTG